MATAKKKTTKKAAKPKAKKTVKKAAKPKAVKKTAKKTIKKAAKPKAKKTVKKTTKKATKPKAKKTVKKTTKKAAKTHGQEDHKKVRQGSRQEARQEGDQAGRQAGCQAGVAPARPPDQGLACRRPARIRPTITQKYYGSTDQASGWPSTKSTRPPSAPTQIRSAPASCCASPSRLTADATTQPPPASWGAVAFSADPPRRGLRRTDRGAAIRPVQSGWVGLVPGSPPPSACSPAPGATLRQSANHVLRRRSGHVREHKALPRTGKLPGRLGPSQL